MLQFLDVKKEYGGLPVLSIPGLLLPEGIYWLNGANGSGKTTLLKILAGLIPFTGDILLDGANLRQQPNQFRRLVSYAEAEPAYPPFLTGQELIRFYREIRKSDAGQPDGLIDKLGTGRFLSAPIGTYSSGMLKRLSLLLAFIGHTKLILLDEPLATLDADVSVILPELMMEYQTAYSSSFIFSSHAEFQRKITCQHLLVQDQSVHLIA
jgi:ABC-2 type transport system ATP-binding protein